MVFLEKPAFLPAPPPLASPGSPSSTLWLSQRPSLAVSSRMVSFWFMMVSFCCSTVSRSCSTVLFSSSAEPVPGAVAAHMSPSSGTEVQMKRVCPKLCPRPRRQSSERRTRRRKTRRLLLPLPPPPGGPAAMAGPGPGTGTGSAALRRAHCGTRPLL